VLNDGTPIAVTAGVADREAQTPMRADDLLLAGSTGKTFFAAVALQLIEARNEVAPHRVNFRILVLADIGPTDHAHCRQINDTSFHCCSFRAQGLNIDDGERKTKWYENPASTE
jgi:hypothetical protein